MKNHEILYLCPRFEHKATNREVRSLFSFKNLKLRALKCNFALTQIKMIWNQPFLMMHNFMY